ncbi:hypothetical protein FACS189431_1690 [Alphaproteobacteria bacterium]|nr:hypothetical protein FACS189431_1690 [Alphaproteobacteria bacterium]
MLSQTNYFERIDKIEQPNEPFGAISHDYNLGNVIDTKVIELGYEDFNSIITTDRGKFFTKIFANSRDTQEISGLVERIVVAVENGVSSPKVYQNTSGENYSHIALGDSEFRVMVTDFIDGKDFYSAGVRPTDEDLDEIVKIAADLQNINYEPSFIYDSWAISSFTREFERVQSQLEPKYLELVKPVYERFKDFDYEKLPKGYTHGDMISTNLIKDQNDKVWLVDYSVANYTARLNEIAVIACDVAMIPGDISQSRERINQVFEKWSESVGATDFEKESFPLLLDVANAIHIMNSAIEKQNGNDSDENDYFLSLGLFGLSAMKGVEK